MITLFSNTEYFNAKSTTKLALQCEYCGEKFFKQKKDIKHCIQHNTNYNKYCSTKCQGLARTKKEEKKCTVCGSSFVRTPSEMKDSTTGLFFCSSSCAATHNNKAYPKKIKQIKVKQIKVKLEPFSKEQHCKICGDPLTKETAYVGKSKRTFKTVCKKCRIKKVCDDWIQLKKDVVKQMGGKCQDCGGIFTYQLYDFHHLDPSKKEYGWTKMKMFNKAKRDKELEKCVLLCGNCHRIRHAEDEYSHTKNNHKTESEEIIFNKRTGKQRFCVHCEQPLTNKNVSKNGENFRSICKKCSLKIATKRKNERKQKIVTEFGNKCFICKQQLNPCVYDFHHVNPTQKEYSFGQIKTREYSVIMKELSKCIMVCTNCHRTIHIDLKLHPLLDSNQNYIVQSDA